MQMTRYVAVLPADETKMHVHNATSSSLHKYSLSMEESNTKSRLFMNFHQIYRCHSIQKLPNLFLSVQEYQQLIQCI